MAEHRHRPVPLKQARQFRHPGGRAAQGQVQHRVRQLRQGQLLRLAHIHQLDGFTSLQPLLQLPGADAARRLRGGGAGSVGVGHGWRRPVGGGVRMGPICCGWMKGRSFLALLLALILGLSGLGLGAWWLVWQRSPLQLQHRPLALPAEARFVPRSAALALYLATDGEEPVRYARAVAPTRRRRAAVDALERLRDGAFAAAGLDYRNELASWLAPGLGLALFDEPSGGWLLALHSRDDQGARRFLQRFWQTRSLAGTDLQVSSYRGMGLISGRGGLVGREALPLATALVGDDLVLLASGRGVLEQALDVSQVEELHQASLQVLQRGIDRLGEGAGLLVARPEALERWLGLAAPAAAAAGATEGPAMADQRPGLLLAALRPEGADLQLEGLLELPAAAPLPAGVATGAAGAGGGDRALLAALRGSPARLALLRNTPALRGLAPLQPLLEGILSGGADAGPLPALVAAADAGALLVAEGSQGWLLGTAAAEPALASLEAPLAAEGLVQAPLQVGDRTLQVWTRLRADGAGRLRPADASQVRAELAGWRSEEGSLAWWGRSLALLDGRSGAAEAQERRLQALDLPAAPLRWALDGGEARALLAGWQPWRLLGLLAGGGLGDPVQGLAVAVEPETGTLHWQARLELG